jgi:hypothetical protein
MLFRVNKRGHPACWWARVFALQTSYICNVCSTSEHSSTLSPNASTGVPACFPNPLFTNPTLSLPRPTFDPTQANHSARPHCSCYTDCHARQLAQLIGTKPRQHTTLCLLPKVSFLLVAEIQRGKACVGAYRPSAYNEVGSALVKLFEVVSSILTGRICINNIHASASPQWTDSRKRIRSALILGRDPMKLVSLILTCGDVFLGR